MPAITPVYVLGDRGDDTIYAPLGTFAPEFDGITDIRSLLFSCAPDILIDSLLLVPGESGGDA